MPVALLTCLLAASPSLDDRPLAIGVLVAPGAKTDSADLRLGRLAGGFARAGVESFVAPDMIRPPPNADRPIMRARGLSADADRLIRGRRFQDGVAAADQAIDLLEGHASERAHLGFLARAYVVRGAAAVALDDPITAETMFLKAVALRPDAKLSSPRYPRRVRRLYRDVRRASRLLRYGSIRIEVPGLSRAEVSVDFGRPRPPPYAAKLPDGRHFITVTAPGRPDLVLYVAVRAERQTIVEARPPTYGDADLRARALADYSPDAPKTVDALARAAGLRFVAVARIEGGVVHVVLHDALAGEPFPQAKSTLSLDPAPREVDAAVESILQAVLTREPGLLNPDEAPGWYSTWWGVTLIGVAVAGAAAATAVVLTRDRQTEYRFEP